VGVAGVCNPVVKRSHLQLHSTQTQLNHNYGPPLVHLHDEPQLTARKQCNTNEAMSVITRFQQHTNATQPQLRPTTSALARRAPDC
jgi:hypothetical protein